jgi:hypothetical protein
VVNIFLLIELLGAANPGATMEALKKLDIPNCTLASVAQLADDKLAAKLDCKTYKDASTAILESIAPIEGIVQTNVVAAVRPVHPK